MQEQLILGTAGHIDHGKTSLIRLLTGAETDRLSQEKERGITIELGFAQIHLPSGRALGVIDVPGHERFVRQMIAGATGIDVALITVAADDGIMPQTREHLAIMELLDISHAVVALTKADLVDKDWLELVRNDVEKLLSDTVFAGAPIVPVSSETGEGKQEILEALDSVVAETSSARSVNLPARLPCDRVFTLKGVGTVVTGTLWSGTFAPDDQAEVYPERLKVRVRNVQVHDQDVERAYPGQRVALNLVGVEKSDISRGDVVAEPGSLTQHDRFDAYFTYVGKLDSDAPFVSGTRVHINHGTTEVIGRILLTNEQKQLQKGEKALVQVRLEEPLMLQAEDRFIVRSYSPVTLIGGGEVLLTSPARRTHLSETDERLLNAILHDKHDEAVLAFLENEKFPLTAQELSKRLDAPLTEVTDTLATLSEKVVALSEEGATYYTLPALLAELKDEIEQELVAFHESNPTTPSISSAALADKVMRNHEQSLFDALLAEMERDGRVKIERGAVSHPTAGVGAKEHEQQAAEKIYELVDTGFNPPYFNDLIEATGLDSTVARSAINSLIDDGKLVRISADYLLTTENFNKAKQIVADVVDKNGGQASTSDLKDAFGVSRKYMVPLLEYLDRIGYTKRTEDTRKLG